MKKAALSTLLMLVITGLTYAIIAILPTAGGTVKGRITDEATGEPIIGGTVVAYVDKEMKAGAATDIDGNYSLNLPAGTYSIEVKSLGYATQRLPKVVVVDGKTETCNIKLNAEAKTLGAVVVTESKYSKSTPARVESVDTYESPAMMSAPGVSVSGSSYKSKSSGEYRSAPAKKADKGEIKGESKRFETTKTDTKAVKEPDTRAGQLTAGEWSDTRNWGFFTELNKKKDWNKMPELWGFDISNRYAVKVTSGGKPQNDVPVVLKDKKGNILFEARSDNNGYCYLFAGLTAKGEDGATVEVKTAGGTKSVAVGEPGSPRATTVDITNTKRVANKVDIMFTIDATGSMGDEMNYLKEELSDVIRRVKAGSEQMVDIRLSANVYRDKGDEYVVRPFAFTTDVSKVLGDLGAQYAGGGGDFEEAVEEGLDDAINKHEWSEDATARLLFLVLDAPPHNTAENKTKIYNAVLNAAKKGIRIIPVASSGIDKNTEFFLRYIAAATGGTYVFLTDHSGIGGSHIEPTVGKYDVEYLNNLLVRLIQAYLTTES